MKKKRSPFLWLLMIPVKILLDVVLFACGIGLDIEYWSRQYEKGTMQGHGVPFITIIFLGIICVTSVIVFLVSVIVTCVKLYLRSKAQKAAAEEWEREQTRREEEHKKGTANENRNGYTGYGWKE